MPEGEQQDAEADRHGDGEADGEEVQLRRGAGQDAEGDIGDEQGGDHWQSHQQTCAKNQCPRADQHHPAFLVQVAAADREPFEAPGQGVEHQQVAIEGQEDEGGQEGQEFGHNGGLPTGHGVEEGGKGEAHLQADEFAHQVERRKYHAHCQPHGNADQGLFKEDEQPGPGVEGNVCCDGKGRGDTDAHGQPDHQLDAPGQGVVAEHGPCTDQAEHPGQRKGEEG